MPDPEREYFERMAEDEPQRFRALCEGCGFHVIHRDDMRRACERMLGGQSAVSAHAVQRVAYRLNYNPYGPFYVGLAD